MGYLTEVKKELNEKGKLEQLTAKRLIILEQAFFKDNAIKCEKCDSQENLTLDHIIPKELLTQLGIDTKKEFVENNYGILCRRCNAFKANRLDFSNKKTKTLLLKLLNNIN